MAVLPLHGLLLMSATAHAAIVSFTGDVQIASGYPASAEETVFEDDSTLGGWEEAQVLTLPVDVEVDIAELGTYNITNQSAPGILPAGTVVSSHYFHGDSTGNARATWSGSLTFDAPVIAIQIFGDTMQASDSVFNLGGTVFDPRPAERDFDTPLDDTLIIDPADPYTVRFEHYADTAMDEFRVITAAAEASITGSCPGTIEVAWSAFTPGGDVAIVSSAGPGATPVPAGPCAGQAILDLASPVTLRGILPIAADGTGSLSPTLQTSGPCGASVQLLDLTTCAVSEVVTVP